MEIVAMSVAKEERNKGLGRQVLGQLITESEDAVRPIWLHTRKGNKGARRFFGRAGFEALPESDFRQDSDSSYIALERTPRG
jgi:ribosomal protein S18 acetylase RimI-like enzyme